MSGGASQGTTGAEEYDSAEHVVADAVTENRAVEQSDAERNASSYVDTTEDIEEIDDNEAMEIVYDLAYGRVEDVEFDADANGVTDSLLEIPIWLFPDPQGRYIPNHEFTKEEIKGYIEDLEDIYISLPESHTADLLMRYIEVATFWFHQRFRA